MTSAVRRATAFAFVGAVTLIIPLSQRFFSPAGATIVATAPFFVMAVVALRLVTSGVLFELFARPGDRRDGRLYGLASFSLAIAGVALLAIQFEMPIAIPVVAVWILTIGNLGSQIVRASGGRPIDVTVSFIAGGFLAGLGAQIATGNISGSVLPLAEMIFLSTSGALAAGLLRSVLFERDDALVILSISLLLWLFAEISISITMTGIGIALAITAALGYVSYVLETASLPGMVTGVLLSLLTIVVGDYGWFAMLITFFGGGGLVSKFKHDAKLERGIAESNEGARGSANVLANSVVALFAVLAAASSPRLTNLPPELFLFVFAGSVASAMSDTFSSELGGLYDDPRLITTLEPVDSGTDGGVTWQGGLAGLAGAAIIAGIAFGAFETIGVLSGAIIVTSGFFGMIIDSFLGATIEGTWVGNQAVNFLSTLVGGSVAGILALGTGVVVP